MNAFVFAYVLRLRGNSQERELLELLPPRYRAEVAEALEQSPSLSVEDTRLRISVHRLEQCSRQRMAAEARLGIELNRLSPKLARWLARPF